MQMCRVVRKRVNVVLKAYPSNECGAECDIEEALIRDSEDNECWGKC